jgi:hypothetical protein
VSKTLAAEKDEMRVQEPTEKVSVVLSRDLTVGSLGKRTRGTRSVKQGSLQRLVNRALFPVALLVKCRQRLEPGETYINLCGEGWNLTN